MYERASLNFTGPPAPVPTGTHTRIRNPSGAVHPGGEMVPANSSQTLRG